MKKKYVFLLLVFAFLLCSCEKKVEPIAPLYPCSYLGVLSFEDLQYHLTLQIDQKGICQMEITEPKELDGTKYRIEGEQITLICDDVEVVLPTSQNDRILRLAKCFFPDEKCLCSAKETKDYKLFTYTDNGGTFEIKTKDNKISEIKATGKNPFAFKTKKG